MTLQLLLHPHIILAYLILWIIILNVIYYTNKTETVFYLYSLNYIIRYNLCVSWHDPNNIWCDVILWRLHLSKYACTWHSTLRLNQNITLHPCRPTWNSIILVSNFFLIFDFFFFFSKIRIHVHKKVYQ